MESPGVESLGLTDADVIALINGGGLGGRLLLPWDYDRIDDWTLVNVYLAPHDDDGRLIPIRKRMLVLAGGQTGDPDQVGRELPAPDSLDIPHEALHAGYPMSYTVLFWKVWKQRGLATEAIMEKFKETLKVYKPRGFEQATE
jgi:hypothetical protein